MTKYVTPEYVQCEKCNGLGDRGFPPRECRACEGTGIVPAPLKPRRRTRRHWYRIHITECPACGRWSENRERVYGRKPKARHKTHIIRDVWDGCEL